MNTISIKETNESPRDFKKLFPQQTQLKTKMVTGNFKISKNETDKKSFDDKISLNSCSKKYSDNLKNEVSSIKKNKNSPLLGSSELANSNNIAISFTEIPTLEKIKSNISDNTSSINQQNISNISPILFKKNLDIGKKDSSITVKTINKNLQHFIKNDNDFGQEKQEKDNILTNNSNLNNTYTNINNTTLTNITNCYNIKDTNNIEILQLENYKVIATIGIGSLSKVKLCQNKLNNQVIAVKLLQSKNIVNCNLTDKVRNEFEILKTVNHPFIIKLKSINLTSNHIFFGLEYMPGGDLFSLLRIHGNFSLDETKFYVAQIICGIVYLHSLNIIYRDIKPENFLLNSNGYLKITDFSISKICKGKTYTFCGTSEYCAPEIVNNLGHTKACDLWSLGVLIYEFLVGITPFWDANPIKIYHNINSGKFKFPTNIDPEAKIFIKQLLIADPRKRLGVGDFSNKIGSNCVSDLVNNPFFDKFDWIGLEKQTLSSYHTPKIKNNADTSNFAHYCEDSYENLLDYAFDNEDNLV